MPKGSRRQMNGRPAQKTKTRDLRPLDPLLVRFVESLAVADFWADYEAAVAKEQGAP